MKLFLEIEPGVGHSGRSELGVNEAEPVGPGSLALEMGPALGCRPQTEAAPRLLQIKPRSYPQANSRALSSRVAVGMESHTNKQATALAKTLL